MPENSGKCPSLFSGHTEYKLLVMPKQTDPRDILFIPSEGEENKKKINTFIFEKLKPGQFGLFY